VQHSFISQTSVVESTHHATDLAVMFSNPAWTVDFTRVGPAVESLNEKQISTRACYRPLGFSFFNGTV
jgi:hypothetical protein